MGGMRVMEGILGDDVLIWSWAYGMDEVVRYGDWNFYDTIKG